MLATEVGKFGTWLGQHALAKDRIWKRHLEQVRPGEVMLFYARARLNGLERQAHEAIEVLQSELLLHAMIKGDVSSDAMRLILHEVPQERFTVDEFLDQMVRLDRSRRQALLVCLDTHSEAQQVVNLTWREVTAASQTPSIAREVFSARAKLRHIKLPYVFWEWATADIAAPLVNLKSCVEAAFGETWASVQMHWDDMIWVDLRADGRRFTELIEEAAAGKL